MRVGGRVILGHCFQARARHRSVNVQYRNHAAWPFGLAAQVFLPVGATIAALVSAQQAYVAAKRSSRAPDCPRSMGPEIWRFAENRYRRTGSGAQRRPTDRVDTEAITRGPTTHL